jgi:hypothetical protein
MVLIGTQTSAMNPEQRFDELDRIVADGRDLLARLQTARHQIIGKAIGVALQLGERHLPRAVGQRDAIRKPLRRPLQQIADRHPSDPAGTGDATGCREIAHVYSLPRFVVARSEATKQSILS